MTPPPPRSPRPRPGGQPGRPGRPAPQAGAGGGGWRGGGDRRAAPPRPEGLGGDQVEGLRAVRELLAARRRRVRDLWVSDSADPEHPLVAEILDLAAAGRVPLRRVVRGRLDAEARTEAPQGVLAHADPLPEVALDALVAGARSGRDRTPLLVVLDGVTDPQNLGAVLRVADGSGATGVVLGRRRSVHVTPAVTKAAAGAVEHVPIAVVPGIPAALQVIGAAGVWTVGLDDAAPDSLFALDLAREPVAVVLGAEGSGLSRLVRQRCDVLVSIPQLGRLQSLNVAAAAAVACYEIARRRLAPPPSA